jgi:hypothetical protein
MTLPKYQLISGGPAWSGKQLEAGRLNNESGSKESAC